MSVYTIHIAGAMYTLLLFPPLYLYIYGWVYIRCNTEKDIMVNVIISLWWVDSFVHISNVISVYDIFGWGEDTGYNFICILLCKALSLNKLWIDDFIGRHLNCNFKLTFDELVELNLKSGLWFLESRYTDAFSYIFFLKNSMVETDSTWMVLWSAMGTHSRP